MGHVARHCFAAWKKPGAKKSNHANPNPVPNVLEKNISITLCKIWVAKAATAGGASGSTRPILEALFGSSKVKGAVLFQQNST
jgi:hypothetical protein